MDKIKVKLSEFKAWLGRTIWFGLKIWMWLLIGLVTFLGAFFVLFKKGRKSKSWK